jgi:phytoene dehydrogenase-like protein
MGMVSFAIADAAREAGAALACGVPVAEIVPGEGVTLEDGTRLTAASVICMRIRSGCSRCWTARRWTPRSRSGSSAGRSAARSLSSRGAGPAPELGAAPGETWAARATIDVTGTMDEAQRAFEACERGEPAVEFGEIYIQTVYDPSPAPEGRHLLSVFGQYAPYTLSDGTWDSRREEVARQFIDLIDRFAPGFEDCLVDHEVLGPPDIESRIGLTGGNIFQGEVTPDPDVGGAARGAHPGPGAVHVRRRHPSGRSVIALNGRNAAAAVLADAGIALAAA